MWTNHRVAAISQHAQEKFQQIVLSSQFCGSKSSPQRRRWALPTCWVYRCRASKELLWQSIRSTTAQLGPTGPHIGNQQQILGAAQGELETKTHQPEGHLGQP